TFRLLEHAFDRAVLMYQWEFARRMRASPGTADYSRLTVGVYRRAACEILERVPRNAFCPQPRVDSAIVSLVPRPSPFPLEEPGRFDAVVDALFAHRRKTVENGLRLGWAAFARSREALEALLPGVPDRTRRVGAVSPAEIARGARAIRVAPGHRRKGDGRGAKAKAMIEWKRKHRASGPTDVGAELRALTRRVSQVEMRQQTASLSRSKENELIGELKESMKRLKVLQSLKA